VAAIGSRPIRAHHSSHVHASFLYGIELCCIRCKKLVQEKSCTRNHVRRSSFLYKSTCASFLTVCHHHYVWMDVHMYRQTDIETGLKDLIWEVDLNMTTGHSVREK